MIDFGYIDLSGYLLIAVVIGWIVAVIWFTELAVWVWKQRK